MAAKLRYKYNEDYFATPNLENSYWAGFIAADGCVYHPGGNKRNILSIQLQDRDVEHLESFRDCLDSDRPVLRRSRFTRGKDRTYCRLLVTSNKICDDLLRVFNISQRKTMTLKPPMLDEKNALAYIAGYIDGDGTYYSNRGRLAIRIIGQTEILSWMKDVLVSNKNVAPVLGKNLHQIEFHGDEAIAIEKKFEKLNLPRLKRKVDLLDSLNMVPTGRAAPYEHGTYRMWRTKGCRCDDCVAAVNARNREYYRAKILDQQQEDLEQS